MGPLRTNIRAFIYIHRKNIAANVFEVEDGDMYVIGLTFCIEIIVAVLVLNELKLESEAVVAEECDPVTCPRIHLWSAGNQFLERCQKIDMTWKKGEIQVSYYLTVNSCSMYDDWSARNSLKEKEEMTPMLPPT